MVSIDTKAMAAVSPATWAEMSRIVLANGDMYAFDERPYLINPLESLARLVCVRKARGLGFSETFILKSVQGLDAGRFSQGVQYVFPTDTDMRKFVQSRFNVVLKKNPRTLGKLVKDTDTTYYKRVGEGNLFMDGGGVNKVIEGMQAESMTFRGTQVDMAVIDELDMFDNANEVVKSALTSMMNSCVKSVHALSNPSIPGYGIDGLFQQSNQMYWYRECKCGELTCVDKEFPNLIDRKGCHCKKCGDLLGWRGLWLADLPQRNSLYGPNSKDWEGYHISDLNAPKVHPFSILEQWQDKSEMNLEKVHKFSLGLPYLASTAGLTLFEVYECCGFQPECDRYDQPTIMGVDVGSSSGMHVVIGLRTGKDTYEVLRVDRLESFDDVAVLGHRFNVKICVCDMMPEVTAARRFQKDAGFKVWLNLYNHTNPTEEATWDQDKRMVKVFRNFICDTSHRVVAEKRVKLPRRSAKLEEFAKQYVDMVKWHDDAKNVYRYIGRSGEGRSRKDHYRHAMNYFLTACRVSSVTRQIQMGKKVSNKAVHETVKI